MVFERTSQIVTSKLGTLGITIPHKLCRTFVTETWVNERTKKVFLNPKDSKSKMLANQTRQHLLLHELGHIFVHRFINIHLRKNPEFVELFGDFSKFYRRKFARIKTNKDFISTYAQVHPEDNFCEVFAVYCAHEGKIRKVYKHLKKSKKSKRVRKQVYWIHKFVRELRQ